MERLRERGLDESEAIARVEAQAPAEAKLAVADYVIDTDCTLEETRTRSAGGRGPGRRTGPTTGP